MARLKTDIQALVLDVDGTLTDGRMNVLDDGNVFKSFHTKDAHGIRILISLGVRVCVITGDSSNACHHRVKKMNISEKDYFHGIQDKIPVLTGWLEENNISFKKACYGGDDLNDLECVRTVGSSFCPADAVEKIKSEVQYVCEKNGGFGAVREYIDKYLLD
ncbi:MAG: KdsC family phosphatase [Bdellovibrionales bacterium]